MENVQEIEKETGFLFRRPSLMDRIKSMLVDSVVLIMFMYLMTIILEQAGITSGNIRMGAMVLIFLYEPIFVALGGTIGQRVMGLKVRKSQNYIFNKEKKNINLFNSLIRYVVKLLLGWISLLTIHSDPYGQAIHDKAGSSVMTFK